MNTLETQHWFFIQTEFISEIRCCTYDGSKLLGWKSISAGYPSREALLKGADIQPEPCVKCGKLWGASFDKFTRPQMIERGMCFYCNFWTNRVIEHQRPKTLHKSAIIKGVAQWIHPMAKGERSCFLGHGGHVFRIQFNDGFQVESNDVWCQGSVPLHFRDELPDNAVYLPNEEKV